MKREPYTTKLTTEQLQNIPVSMLWRENITPQLAVISRIIKQGNGTYMLMMKSLSQRGRTVCMPRWARKTAEPYGDLMDAIEVEDIWYDPFDVRDPFAVWLEVGDHIIYFTSDNGEVVDNTWVMGWEFEDALKKIARTIHYRVTSNGEEVYLGRSHIEAQEAVEASMPRVGQLGEEMSRVLGTAISESVEVVIEYRQGPNGAWTSLES